MSLVEGWALWHGHWWGPWLVVAATGSLLPFEVVAVVRQLHAVRVVLFFVNAGDRRRTSRARRCASGVARAGHEAVVDAMRDCRRRSCRGGARWVRQPGACRHRDRRRRPRRVPRPRPALGVGAGARRRGRARTRRAALAPLLARLLRGAAGARPPGRVALAPHRRHGQAARRRRHPRRRRSTRLAVRRLATRDRASIPSSSARGKVRVEARRRRRGTTSATRTSAAPRCSTYIDALARRRSRRVTPTTSTRATPLLAGFSLGAARDPRARRAGSRALPAHRARRGGHRRLGRRARSQAFLDGRRACACSSAADRRACEGRGAGRREAARARDGLDARVVFAPVGSHVRPAARGRRARRSSRGGSRAPLVGRWSSSSRETAGPAPRIAGWNSMHPVRLAPRLRCVGLLPFARVVASSRGARRRGGPRRRSGRRSRAFHVRGLQ